MQSTLAFVFCNFLLSEWRHIISFAQVTLDGRRVSSTTVAQLRYLQLSLAEVWGGLNGFSVIKEEKANVVKALADTGEGCVSATEIATKLASRQLVVNRTGMPSPASLDGGDLCRSINEDALRVCPLR